MRARVFPAAGLDIVLLGENLGELGGSEYLKTVHGLLRGVPPALDLARERALQRLLVDSCRTRLVRIGARLRRRRTGRGAGGVLLRQRRHRRRRRRGRRRRPTAASIGWRPRSSASRRHACHRERDAGATGRACSTRRARRGVPAARVGRTGGSAIRIARRRRAGDRLSGRRRGGAMGDGRSPAGWTGTAA